MRVDSVLQVGHGAKRVHGVRMNCGDSIRVVHPLFPEEGGGSIPTSPLQMMVEPTSFDFALRLNALWHSRMPRMGTGFIKDQPFPCFLARFKGYAFAVGIWSNPVARNLPQVEWLELRRLAIAPDAPRNTASWMLAKMRRILRRERPWTVRLVSYHDMDVHTGTIYRAAGWTPTAINTNGNWSRRKRTRPAAQSPAKKQRWECAA